MMGVFLHHGFFAATLNRRTPNKRDQNRGRKLRRKNNHMENPGTKEVIFVDLGVTCASVFFFIASDFYLGFAPDNSLTGNLCHETFRIFSEHTTIHNI